MKKEESDDVDGTNPPKKPKIEDDNVMRKQNQSIYRYRDQLKALTKKHLIALLEYNNQQIPSGIDSVSDLIFFLVLCCGFQL